MLSFLQSEKKEDSRGLLMVCCLGGASLFAGVAWSMRSVRKQAAEFPIFVVMFKSTFPTTSELECMRKLVDSC